MLSSIHHGTPGSGRPLVIAHGLFGSARNWGVVAKRLSDSRPVIAVDMRNHGDSPHDADHSYPALAADLAEVIEDLGGAADVLGHSMGGKAAMVLAHTRPDLVSRLIVADIAPVNYTHTQAPVVAALSQVDLGKVARRSDADSQLAPHVEDPQLRAFLLQSLDLSGERPRWKLNLASLADQMPLIMGFPDIDPEFRGPAVVVRGGASDYVTGAHADKITRLFPQARIVTMEGAAHWLHAEDPRGFERVVREILD